VEEKMRVGIIVYSKTGNTLSVAERLEKALSSAGHDVEIQKVKVNSDKEGSTGKLSLISNPDVTPYDAIIFAAPVHAFSLAPAMKLYLGQIADLSKKKVYGFVTQQFKKPWLGGNRAIRKLNALCQKKGAELQDTGIVNWSNSKREKQIEELVHKLSNL